MPTPVTVWMVELELSTVDVEGKLELDDEALRFTAEARTRTIPLSDVTKVKRIVGSPVLMILSREDEVSRHTAFYFRKPPPLKPPEASVDEPATLMGPFNRSKPPSKRKQRRTNVTYLASAATGTAESVKEWLVATRAAVAAAKGR
jgi:hypothetical protein